MDERYRDEIINASRLLTRAILDRETDLEKAAVQVDALTRGLLREIGRETVLAVWTQLRERLTARARAQGMRLHKCSVIAVMTLFGVLSLVSPGLLNRRCARRTSRPQRSRQQTRPPAPQVPHPIQGCPRSPRDPRCRAARRLTRDRKLSPHHPTEASEVALSLVAPQYREQDARSPHPTGKRVVGCLLAHGRLTTAGDHTHEETKRGALYTRAIVHLG